MTTAGLVVLVAPWDWHLLPWSLGGWAGVVDEVVLAFERRGLCHWCPVEHEHEQAPVLAMLELARWFGAHGLRVRAMTYDRPDPWPEPPSVQHAMEWESRVRNAGSSLLSRGIHCLAADADERPTDPVALRRELAGQIVGSHARYLLRPSVEVVRVQGAAALVARPDRWGDFGAARPGRHRFSRVCEGREVRLHGSGFCHWRADATEGEKVKEAYLGAGWATWKATAEAGPCPRWSDNPGSWERLDWEPIATLGWPLPPAPGEWAPDTWDRYLVNGGAR